MVANVDVNVKRSKPGYLNGRRITEEEVYSLRWVTREGWVQPPSSHAEANLPYQIGPESVLVPYQLFEKAKREITPFLRLDRSGIPHFYVDSYSYNNGFGMKVEHGDMHTFRERKCEYLEFRGTKKEVEGLAQKLGFPIPEGISQDRNIDLAGRQASSFPRIQGRHQYEESSPQLR